ncbi:hypothetical protein L1987_42381 [Smallanthus sonchifolius]|uniref:Uncharacterized protein n=1 Tax=Smallanthus sonchifolius TaxID=185202 RepID=A0ACB9GJS7_9ASTR|nr:hypothetical protein L1987_42381 [Smallanthus sonchifolius]
MIFQGLKFFLEDGKSKKFLAYPIFLQHPIHQAIPNLPELEDTLDLTHLNPRVFVNMKKNHSRSTFSGNETPLFPEMMGFSDVESSEESESSSSSSRTEVSDDSDNDDDPDGEGDNINSNVEFDHVELHTTQDTPPISGDSSPAASPKVISKDSPPKDSVSKEAKTTSKTVQDPVLSQSTPRKKSIPKIVIKKQSDIIIPNKDKYLKLFSAL